MLGKVIYVLEKLANDGNEKVITRVHEDGLSFTHLCRGDRKWVQSMHKEAKYTGGRQ